MKDALPTSASSKVIYKYVCNCGDSYVGRTRRRLATRVREHVPVWFTVGRSGKPLTSVTKHIVQCPLARDDTDIRSKFRIVSRARSRNLLSILEALYIKLEKPVLCAQKEFVWQLSLPW